MSRPVLSRKAYITITIGTLLLSGAFLVLSINYANTTGVFYTARNMPIIHFTNELEALTSLLYSLPEDAYVEYRGPHACSWSQRLGKFVCEGGLEIDDVSAAVTFTKDERMLYTPRTACIYMSFGTLKAVAGKAKKALLNEVKDTAGDKARDMVTEGMQEATEELIEKKAKSRLSKLRDWIDDIKARKSDWVTNVKSRLGMVRGMEVDDIVSMNAVGRPRHEAQGAIADAIRRGDTTFDNSKFLKNHYDDADDYAKSIMDDIIADPNGAMARHTKDMIDGVPGAGRGVYATSYSHLKRAEDRLDVMENGMNHYFLTHTGDLDMDDWLNHVKAEDLRKYNSYIEYTYVGSDGVRRFKPVKWMAATPFRSMPDWASKLRYYRDLPLWAQTTATGYAAYRSCRTDDPLWELVDFLTGNQILFQVDLDSADSFYDFYAGKYGAVTIDFTTDEDEIKAVKSYGVNGEDMCFLRNQLSYFGGNYETPSLEMSDGKIVLSKNKETFDTLCGDGDSYYPIGVGEIADYVKKACKGSDQTFDVYVTPARFFSYENGMLCENHFARNEEGEEQGNFKLFCYDFADIGCSVDVQFENLTIDYTLKDGQIVEPNLLEQMLIATGYDINPSLWELRESGNTYWFKHTSHLLPSVTVDIPFFGDGLDFIFSLAGMESPLDVLSNTLNTIIPEMPLESRSLELKPGFLQSMYYKCSLKADRVGAEVKIMNNGCEPVVLMNWNDILTESYKCGDGVCDEGEDSWQCPTDCPPPLCLVEFIECSGCTEICNNEGYGNGRCFPFELEFTGDMSNLQPLSGARCNTIFNTLPLPGVCYCEV